MKVKDAPKTATTIVIRSDRKFSVISSEDPYGALMERLFQDGRTAERGKKFLTLVKERQENGNPLRASEWKEIIKTLDISHSSFYAMRKKLIGAGMITLKNGEYRIAGAFSRDLYDMARWWWTVVCGNDIDTL